MDTMKHQRDSPLRLLCLTSEMSAARQARNDDGGSAGHADASVRMATLRQARSDDDGGSAGVLMASLRQARSDDGGASGHADASVLMASLRRARTARRLLVLKGVATGEMTAAASSPQR